VPRVRDGSYFPSLLEPRPRVEEALSLRWCWRGTCTRSSRGRSTSCENPRGRHHLQEPYACTLCEELNEELERFRNRSLEGAYRKFVERPPAGSKTGISGEDYPVGKRIVNPMTHNAQRLESGSGPHARTRVRRGLGRPAPP